MQNELLLPGLALLLDATTACSARPDNLFLSFLLLSLSQNFDPSWMDDDDEVRMDVGLSRGPYGLLKSADTLLNMMKHETELWHRQFFR